MTYKDPMLKTDSLKDKAAFITGGGSGLGKSMGSYFASLGADLVIVGRRKEKLASTAREIEEESGRKVHYFSCDIRNYGQVVDTVRKSFELLPHLDILVNNAAGNFISPTEKLSPRAFDSVVDIVLKGSFYCTHVIGNEWIKQGMSGNVLNITTTYAWTGSPFVVPSACGKAGVLAMTRSLAVEWAKYQIRLNAIAPGPFPTKGAWTRLFPSGLEDKLDPAKQIPVGRYGNHQELANLAAYLVSDFASYINGEVITIDGGEWLKDAGQFSSLMDLPKEFWEELEQMVKKQKKA